MIRSSRGDFWGREDGGREGGREEREREGREQKEEGGVFCFYSAGEFSFDIAAFV